MHNMQFYSLFIICKVKYKQKSYNNIKFIAIYFTLYLNLITKFILYPSLCIFYIYLYNFYYLVLFTSFILVCVVRCSTLPRI